MNRNPHVAVVGATGAVGIEMMKTLEQRNFPVGKLTLLASARSVGKKFKFRGTELTVQELKKDSFGGIDLALFSAGGSISREFAPIAAQAGCVVVEELEHALRRGVTIYGEIVGYGATSDGYDMVAPSGEGAVRCMQQALATVGGPIDYINTHLKKA